MRLLEEALCGGGAIGALLEKVVYDGQASELSLAESMVPVVEKVEVAVSSFDLRAGALEQLGAVFDEPTQLLRLDAQVSDLLE